jgi:hypothetical protein
VERVEARERSSMTKRYGDGDWKPEKVKAAQLKLELPSECFAMTKLQCSCQSLDALQWAPRRCIFDQVPQEQMSMSNRTRLKKS